MASSEEKIALDDTNIDYPEEIFVDGEPGPEPVDPDSTTTIKPKEEADEGKKESKEGAETIKLTLIISGAVVAVIGAIFAIAKKIREASQSKD